MNAEQSLSTLLKYRNRAGLCAGGEGERVMALQSWERTRASRGVEEGHSRSFWGCGGKASFPSTSAGDLRELPVVPLIGEGCCGVGGASRDSAGLGAMEEGLISRGLLYFCQLLSVWDPVITSSTVSPRIDNILYPHPTNVESNLEVNAKN